MKDLYQALQGCPLFDGIDRQDLTGMLGCLGAKQISTKKGQPLFREGDKAIYVGIVLSGSVQLIREAKGRGVPVTCETCPHYFILTEEL